MEAIKTEVKKKTWRTNFETFLLLLPTTQAARWIILNMSFSFDHKTFKAPKAQWSQWLICAPYYVTDRVTNPSRRRQVFVCFSLDIMCCLFVCFLVCNAAYKLWVVSFVMFRRSQWIICWPLFEEGTTRRIVNILQLMFKNRVQHQRFLCWSGFSGIFFTFWWKHRLPPGKHMGPDLENA